MMARIFDPASLGGMTLRQLHGVVGHAELAERELRSLAAVTFDQARRVHALEEAVYFRDRGVAARARLKELL